MLADGTENVRLGRLDSDTHLPATAKVAILEFIADQLPRWRDHPQRPIQHAETRLTEHLCDYLNHIANFSAEWSHIQFRTEAGDETYAGRKIDLAVKPRTAVVIEGRRHTLFDILLPIECKRLPTPTGTDRDEREYVISKHGTTGGIQRFKAGYHGAVHRHGGMVAFVQEETCEFWSARVSQWISALISSKQQGWTIKDVLHLERSDTGNHVTVLSSTHARERGLPDIALMHLWIQMI